MLKHYRSLAVACLLSLVWSVTAQEAGSLELTGENTVIRSYGETYAAAWLQYYLIKCIAKHPEAMTYTCYPAKDAPRPDRAASPVFPLIKGEIPEGKHSIIVGTTNHLPETYLTAGERRELGEKPGSILVKRHGEHVVLARHSESPWDFSHITTFLDKVCGIRLYAPSAPGQNDEELWLAMPEDNRIVINDLRILKKPYFAKTTWSSGGHDRNVEWLRMNGSISEGLNLRASHTIISFFPPDKYYAMHPELFPMGKDGTRPKPIGDAWNPCFGNPELAARVAMQEVRVQMERNTRGYLSFGVMDCHYVCQCEPCQTSLKAHDGNAANLWYAFLNIVARQCRKELPNLYLTSYHYSNVGTPTGMTLEPNIVVDNVIKTYHVVDPKQFELEKKGILEMASTGCSWVTHDWDFSAVTPRIYNRQYASFLQWGAQNGMLGAYTEWSGLEYWYLNGARYWVNRQLLSDPYQDVDSLWRQYCEDMYGSGWDEMYQFYDMFAQKHVASSHYYQRQDWPREEAAGFTEADVARQRGLLETAIAKTTASPIIQKRLAAVSRYFRAHELLVQATAKPARLYHQYTRMEGKSGINKEALAFYVNDDGRKLVEFDTYYDTERTIAPDSNAEDKNSSLRFSYRNNYSRALGTIIQAITAEAMGGIDVENATAEDVDTVIKKVRQIFRANLPEKYDRKRAREVEALMEKFLFIPRLKTLPTFDGKLDDAIWKQAAVMEGWTMADLLTPSAVGNRTNGRVMRVGDHIVFGITCYQPRGIWAETPADRFTGTRIWREAGCEFFLGPVPKPGEEGEYFQYIVNSLGAFRGFGKATDNREGVHCAVDWDREGKFYTIEVALPLKVEGMYDYSQVKAFSMNIMQNPFEANTFNSPERIGWAPIFFTAHKPESRALVICE